MSAEVDFGDARLNLRNAWAKVDDASIAPSPVNLRRIQQILTTGGVASKYILITGLLGKYTAPGVHPRAIQKKSELPGAYDARSLCHKVVVPFEKTIGNMFGLSNEPLVGKAARHPEHSKTNPQLRDKRTAALVHDVLEFAHTAEHEEVEALLVAALRIGKQIADSDVSASVDLDSNLQHVIRFARTFLRESDGGARLVGITGAFVTLLNESFTVQVYPPNYADRYARTIGDIEIFFEKELISAYECKHRELNLDDVKHGVNKARKRKVSEYCFVCAAGYTNNAKEETDRMAEEMDVSLVEIRRAIRVWSIVLNPERRARFGDVVSTILRDDMRRAEVANKAAELWNSLE